jgi:hypothetical protein
MEKAEVGMTCDQDTSDKCGYISTFQNSGKAQSYTTE